MIQLTRPFRSRDGYCPLVPRSIQKSTRAGLLSVAALAASAGLIAGCGGAPKTESLRAGIPPRAIDVSQDADGVVFFAYDNGQLFLYDRSRDAVLGSYFISNGQRFVFNPQSGRATLAGNEVNVSGWKKKSRNFEIYFLADSRPANGSVTK